MGSKLTDLADLAPSGDFTLNAFLLELNDDLTDEDLGKLKFLCSGEKITEITYTMDKFNHLIKRGTFSSLCYTLPFALVCRYF